MSGIELSNAIGILEKNVPNPNQGLPDEIFYYREGEYIKLYPLERAGDVGSILINYIASPDDYGDSDVMTDGYSLDFLYKVVDYSVGRIREEQTGE